MELLRVEGLAKTFGARRAVQGVSWSIAAGETVALLGANGAGKSTTMRMIAGVLDPDAGDVWIDGRSVVRHRIAAQSRLGYLAEGAPLYADLTVRGFVSFLGRARGLSRTDLEARLEETAPLAGIETVLDRPIETLSKGYRRRTALAAALIHDPPVLVLDEPTDGLDPNQKAAMRGWLARLSEKRAILISTHQLEEVSAMCSRVLVMADGRIVADDTPGDLAASAGGDLGAAFRRLSSQQTAETAC
ncbi:MAG: ABC transporter ATP-binding protein [Hyphomonadaceae bacterium]